MKRLPTLLLLLILAAAVFLRFWQLDDMPPGWRDDELINSLVISQHVIDGEWRFYYPDASGHEALYHALNALPLYLFGPSAPGIRWLSAFLGSGVILFTYLLAWQLFRRHSIALVAAAGLAFSFWGLMYSRIGLRHVSLVFFATPALALMWRGIQQRLAARPDRPPASVGGAAAFWQAHRFFIGAALLLGLAFYTYFASRGIPLILVAWLGYLLLFNRKPLSAVWSGVWLTLILAGLLAVPLVLTLRSQPEAEARVSELAVPVTAARAGDFRPLLDFTVRTLNMFHSDGDSEFLYNIPGRPVFGPIGALFFWSGVLLAAWAALRREPDAAEPGEPPLVTAEVGAFLLLWWLAGISPGFLSVPPGSLSHTILAQPAVYILAALPVGAATAWLRRRRPGLPAPAVALPLGLLLVASIAWRDLPDYFVHWPARGNTRFLYRADIHDVARSLQADPGSIDVGMAGLLAGPWDRLAFEANLGAEKARIRSRWFDPRRAVLIEPAVSWIGYPVGSDPFAPDLYEETGRTAGGYREVRVDSLIIPSFGQPTCFANGLCMADLVTREGDGYLVNLLVAVDRPLVLPDIPLISNPPPPGVYAGPRLLVFAQFLDADGEYLTGDDALGIDPQTLEVGDKFWQRHRLTPGDGQKPATIAFGLYDPMTGERISTVDGRTAITIDIAGD